jgi:hypothetical protein
MASSVARAAPEQTGNGSQLSSSAADFQPYSQIERPAQVTNPRAIAPGNGSQSGWHAIGMGTRDRNPLERKHQQKTAKTQNPEIHRTKPRRQMETDAQRAERSSIIMSDDTTRISRGAMTPEHHIRRQQLIDEKFLAGEISEHAWANETEWLNAGITALRGSPPYTKRRQALPEPKMH